MKKIPLVAAFLLVFVFSVVAQNDQTDNSDLYEKTKKIDEFGRVSHCDLGARVDNFFIELNNYPNAKGYVILYKGKDFLPASFNKNPYLERIQKNIAFRKYDVSRIVFIDGGFRETVTTELFLVPENGEIPVPTETVSKPEIPKDKTFLFDSSIIYSNYDTSEDEFILPEVKARWEAEQAAVEAEYQAQNQEIDDENLRETFETTENQDEPFVETEETQLTPEEIEAFKFFWINEGYARFIEKQKGSHGVIIFYADDQHYDISKIRSHIEIGVQKLAKSANISTNQIEIVFGGYRNFIALDFWIVPKKGANPIPSPTERPKPVEEETEQ